ncbi:MAG: HAMP domain-containing sensor histidine kinase, partial [Pseudomonadota bacterium]
MNEPRTFFNPLRRSLSGRLLIFTVGFVMLAEVLIFTPSIAKFRLDWLDQRLFDAHLAALTLANMPQSPLSAGVEDELLALVGAEYIQVQNDTVGPYRIGVDVVEADEQIDLTNRDPIRLIIEAFATLFRTGPRTLQVQGMSPGDEAVMVYVTLDEAPLREDMYAYSRNILALSIIISLITAGLVFVSLRALLVSPLKQLTNKMVAFRQDPEDPASLEEPSRRQDEVGIAERELRDMQLQLVGALKQKDRLATLGTAVTMINHDLRNMLSAAAIVSEGLDQTEDPKVKRFAPRLMESIDRAVRLCEMTLDYASKGPEATILGEVDLHHVVSEAAEEALLAGDGEGQVINDVPQDLMIQADRDQLFRLFANVLRNAFQAGATEVTVASAIADGQAATDITDNGPGLPPRARDQLFKPFAGSARLGGTGLGLAIAREIALAHKGDLKLVESNAEGTVFRASLPIRQPANGTGR